MKIGIISDSHDHHVNVLRAVEVFKERNVDYVLHAGDIVAPFTAKAFAGVEGAKFIAVFGNNDGEKAFLKSTIEDFGGQICEDCYMSRIGDKQVFMTHRPDVAENIAASGQYDLIVYGHTHNQVIHKVGRSLVINPGESTDWLTNRSCVVILELEEMSYEVISLDA